MSKRFRAIGLMSGTSMDGIDVALIETDGHDHVEPLGFASYAYDDAFRSDLRGALEDAGGLEQRSERPCSLARVERALTDRHALAVDAFLRAAGISCHTIDLAAFHGQTVLHRPERRLTVQLGDGPRLADQVGIDVVYDLRAADVAAGGQGAPLAPAYHRAMAAKAGMGPIAVLNIGGVANVTFVGTQGELTAFDTGPGNALIDDWIYRKTGECFDRDGACAARGTVDQAVLGALLSDPYFTTPPPKSLDRNYFPARHLERLSLEDGAATLAQFTVEAVAMAERHAPVAPTRWLVVGGGRHNPTIMRRLSERLEASVISAESSGFDGDAVEAEAWAYLGVRSVLGEPITFPGTTGVGRPLTGGVLCPY